MVLGMATMANATLSISVNGSYAVSEITIAPSDELILDIRTNDPMAYLSVDYYALVASPGGTIDLASGVTTVADAGIFIEHSAGAETFVTGLQPGEAGMAILATVQDLTAGIAAGTTLFDLINFHCDALGDTLITLYLLNGDFAVVGVQDSVIVHQVIPEPMTMALLGLGGLFLRRRSK